MKIQGVLKRCTSHLHLVKDSITLDSSAAYTNSTRITLLIFVRCCHKIIFKQFKNNNMTEDKQETLVATIDIRQLKGGPILSINTIGKLKEAQNIQAPSNGRFPMVDIGQSLTIDGKNYTVKSISFKIQAFSMETGSTPGANMYAETYSTDTNLTIEVLVDNVD